MLIANLVCLSDVEETHQTGMEAAFSFCTAQGRFTLNRVFVGKGGNVNL